MRKSSGIDSGAGAGAGAGLSASKTSIASDLG